MLKRMPRKGLPRNIFRCLCAVDVCGFGDWNNWWL